VSDLVYDLNFLVQGFPGRSVHHGTLGWGAVTLIRGGGRVALVDTGTFQLRRKIASELEAAGVTADEVTDLLITHAHHDHALNYTLFPNAAVWISDSELDWAGEMPWGFNPLPELYIRDLLTNARTRRFSSGDELLPGITAHVTPGHTPGSAVFHLVDADKAVLFTGDAAKNRAELLTRTADMSLDLAATAASFDRIWELWQAHPDTLLVPGHDVPMTLDADGRPHFAHERRAAIRTWMSDNLDDMTEISLVEPA